MSLVTRSRESRRPLCAKDRPARPTVVSSRVASRREEGAWANNARAIRTPSYLGVMLQKQESSPSSKAVAMNLGFMNTRANVFRAETTTDAAFHPRYCHPLEITRLSFTRREAISLSQLHARSFIFLPLFFHNQAIEKRNGRWSILDILAAGA